MADYYPTESGRPFQGGRPRRTSRVPVQNAHKTRPRSARYSRLVNQFNRLEMYAREMCEEQQDFFSTLKKERSQRGRNVKGRRSFPPMPNSGGEYRLYYLSPRRLRIEDDCCKDHKVKDLGELLGLAAKVLDLHIKILKALQPHGNELNPTDLINEALSYLQLSRKEISAACVLYYLMARVPDEVTLPAKGESV